MDEALTRLPNGYPLKRDVLGQDASKLVLQQTRVPRSRTMIRLCTVLEPQSDNRYIPTSQPQTHLTSQYHL